MEHRKDMVMEIKNIHKIITFFQNLVLKKYERFQLQDLRTGCNQ